MKVREGDLELTFDETAWVVVKWDDHPAFQRGLRRQSGTKAIDVAGVLLEDEPWFFELKDFRGARVENKGRFDGPLAEEVAGKVRDTMAGVLWAVEREHEDDSVRRVAKATLARSGRLTVVLWVEDDTGPTAAVASALQLAIKRRLRFANAHVLVTSRTLEDPARPIPGLEVRHSATRVPRRARRRSRRR
jgi:hypothetical protein